MKKLPFCVLHGILLLLLTISCMQYSFLLDDEAKLNKWSQVARHYLFGNDGIAHSLLKQFLFIDTDGDLQMATKTNDPDYKVAVTNRNHLALLFKAISRLPASEQPKAIVVDIFFTEVVDTSDDSLLLAFQPMLSKTFFPLAADSSVYNLPNSATANYLPTDDHFYKYDYISKGGSPSLPLLMYQKIEQKEIKNRLLFLWIEGKPYFKSFVTNLYLQNRHLPTGDNAFYYSLRTIGSGMEAQKLGIADVLNDFFQNKPFAGKIVVTSQIII